VAALVAAQEGRARHRGGGIVPGGGGVPVVVLQVVRAGAAAAGGAPGGVKAEIGRLFAKHRGKYGSPRSPRTCARRAGG
jgi:hypothetical protein